MAGKNLKKPLIYMAGGMEKAKSNGAIWRANITPDLNSIGYRVFNPCLEENKIFAQHGLVPSDLKVMNKSRHIKKYRELFKDIVDYDLGIIKKADIVLVYYDESVNLSSGTTSEMTFARYLGKPVYVVLGLPYYQIPAWSLGCVDEFFNSFKDFVDFLKKNNKGGK